MQDITFDDFGMGVGSNVNNLRVLDSYREVLIRKFEVVASTLDQYQNNIVFNTDKEMPLKITAGAGCLSGDTIIKVNRAGKSFRIKLKDAYKRFNGLGKWPGVWDLSINTKIRSYFSDENRIKLNQVLNIVESGVKSLFRIGLENGNYLDCTSDHEVLTKRGWIEAINLTSEDYVYKDSLIKHQKTSKVSSKEKLRDKIIRVGEFHPFCNIRKKSKNIVYYRVPIYRAIYEAHVNGLSLKEFVKLTYNVEASSKLYFVDTSKFCIHHKDFDHSNDVIDNLEEMDKIEHYRLHAKGYKNFKHGVPVCIKVKEVIDLNRKEMTYDIQCEAPHNFVANGIVVHNSGKTQCLFAKALKMVLLDRIDPCSMVLITFTNKAADEIRDRYLNFFRDIIPPNFMVEIPIPHISTIHSFGLSVLYKLFGIRRTIMTESQAVRLLKYTILEVLGVKKVEAEVVKNTLEVIYKVCANNELHFFCCPYFNKGGVFERVYVTDEDMCATDFMKFLNKFSRTGINQKIKQGFVDISFDQLNKIREDYANEAKFSVKQFTDIIGKFTEKKGVSNVADFADMRFLPYWIMNQLVEPLTSVWKQYKYFVVDESQDINCLDLALILTCDEDSYYKFLSLK